MIIAVARERMYDAMKAQNKEKKDFYSFLLNRLTDAVKQKQIAGDPNPTLSADEEIDVIRSIVKQIRKAISDVQEQLPDMTSEQSIADANAFISAREAELAMYEEFLPKQMSDDEIKVVITQAFNQIPDDTHTVVNKGVLMKHLMPLVKGKADGKRVAELADEFLKSL
jgi:uncharacterized protein YqeY